MMVKPAPPIRILAWFLCLILFLTNTLFAYAPETGVWEERRRAMSQSVPDVRERNPILPSPTSPIPQEFASVRPLLTSSRPTSRTVFFIQDIHMNQEAQSNIRKTVASLLDAGAVSLVALEGAFDALQLADFQNHPHQDTVQEVAEILLNENKISGAVAAGVTSGKSVVRFHGVDDRDGYLANVHATRDAQRLQSSLKIKNEASARSLRNEKSKLFRGALADFDRVVEEFRSDEITFADYITELAAMSNETSLSVEMFVEASEMEKALDHTRVETERARLIETLVGRLDEQSVRDLSHLSRAYRDRRIGHTDFYESLRTLCGKTGVNLERFPAMDGYLRYVLLSARLDMTEILRRSRQMEEEIYDRLAKTPEERRLIEDSGRAHLTGKLLEFSLTPDEWKAYQSSVHNLHFEESHSAFERFYQLAEDRDQAIADNLLRLMNDQKIEQAALIAGGFHAAGITPRLLEAGINVAVVTPKLTRVDTQSGTAYLSVFNQERTPLEKLAQGEKLFLSPPVETVHLTHSSRLMVDARTLSSDRSSQLMSRGWAKVKALKRDAVHFISKNGVEIKVPTGSAGSLLPVVMAGAALAAAGWDPLQMWSAAYSVLLPGFGATAVLAAALIAIPGSSGEPRAPDPEAIIREVEFQLAEAERLEEGVAYAKAVREILKHAHARLWGEKNEWARQSMFQDNLRVQSRIHAMVVERVKGQNDEDKSLHVSNFNPVLYETKELGKALKPLYERVLKDIWGDDLGTSELGTIERQMDQTSSAADALVEALADMAFRRVPASRATTTVGVSGSGGRRELLPFSDLDLILFVLPRVEDGPQQIMERGEKMRRTIIDGLRDAVGGRRVGRSMVLSSEETANILNDLRQSEIEIVPSRRETSGAAASMSDENKMRMKEFLEFSTHLLDWRPVFDPGGVAHKINPALEFLLQKETRDRITSLLLADFQSKVEQDGVWAAAHRRTFDLKELPGGPRSYQFIHWLKKLNGPATLSGRATGEARSAFLFLQLFRLKLGAANRAEGAPPKTAVTMKNAHDVPGFMDLAGILETDHSRAWPHNFTHPRFPPGLIGLIGLMHDFYNQVDRLLNASLMALQNVLATTAPFPRKGGQALPGFKDGTIPPYDSVFAVHRRPRAILLSMINGLIRSSDTFVEIGFNESGVSKNPFLAHPEWIVSLFHLSAQSGVPVSGEVVSAIEDASPSFFEKFNADQDFAASARRSFNGIMESDHPISETLWQLRRLGLLGRLLSPAWQRNQNIATLDPLHDYVIDAHVLKAIENYEGIQDGIHPFLDRLLNNIHSQGNRALMRWIILLHDIGKPDWQNPSQETHDYVGAYTVVPFLMEMFKDSPPMSAENMDRLQWVIARDSLPYEFISQKALVNLGSGVRLNPKSVERFVSQLGDVKKLSELRNRLPLLFMLSYLDEAAVEKDRKAKLVSGGVLDTFSLLMDFLLSEGNNHARIVSEAQKRTRRELIEILRKRVGPGKAGKLPLYKSRLIKHIDLYFHLVSDSWFGRSPDLLAEEVEQLYKLRKHAGSVRVIVRSPDTASSRRMSPGEPGEIVLMATLDRPGVLSHFSGLLTLHELNIHTSWIYSRSMSFKSKRHLPSKSRFSLKMIMDRFRVIIPDHVRDEVALATALEADLLSLLHGKKSMREIYAGHGVPYLIAAKPMSVTFGVAVNGASKMRVKGEDFKGMLHLVGRILNEVFHVNIRDADIDTRGRADDVIYIDRIDKETEEKIEYAFAWISQKYLEVKIDPDLLIKELREELELPAQPRNPDPPSMSSTKAAQIINTDLKQTPVSLNVRQADRLALGVVKQLESDGPAGKEMARSLWRSVVQKFGNRPKFEQIRWFVQDFLNLIPTTNLRSAVSGEERQGLSINLVLIDRQQEDLAEIILEQALLAPQSTTIAVTETPEAASRIEALKKQHGWSNVHVIPQGDQSVFQGSVLERTATVNWGSLEACLKEAPFVSEVGETLKTASLRIVASGDFSFHFDGSTSLFDAERLRNAVLILINRDMSAFTMSFRTVETVTRIARLLQQQA